MVWDDIISHLSRPRRLLLQRSDIDITIRDNEGYTAFDVYNSTLAGTKPTVDEMGAYAELHTWGTNVCVLRYLRLTLNPYLAPCFRNATLGLGDSNDRAYPEHVSLQYKDDVEDLERKNLSARFWPTKVKDVVMSKLHTGIWYHFNDIFVPFLTDLSAVITSESAGNLRVCGFGSGGRYAKSLRLRSSISFQLDLDHALICNTLSNRFRNFLK